MKHWLMEILVCPIEDCRSSLHLEVYESHQIETDDEQVEEINEALLTCPKCNRWYPVIEGIACMLPDDLRMKGKQHIEETRFLKKWEARVSVEILQDGIPFGLTQT